MGPNLDIADDVALLLLLRADDNTLTVGTSGNVYMLDISTGTTGNIIKTISGIPGMPVDIIIK